MNNDEILTKLLAARDYRLPRDDFAMADLDPLFFRGALVYEYPLGPRMISLSPTGLRMARRVGQPAV